MTTNRMKMELEDRVSHYRTLFWELKRKQVRSSHDEIMLDQYSKEIDRLEDRIRRML